MKMTCLKRNGHERYRFFRKGNGPMAERRRKSALQRIENQLVSNKKVDGEGNIVPLEEGDRERISREIATLKIKLSIT